MYYPFQNKLEHLINIRFCRAVLFFILLSALLITFFMPESIYASETSSGTVPAGVVNHDISSAGPQVDAAAAIVMEANTGAILYEKDIYSAYYPASITKLMTVLLALENCSLNEVVTMSTDAEMNVYGSRIGLVRGEQLTLESALYGIMLESANEATYAVAEHVGGDYDTFISMMNAKAAELGCVNSNFVNPHGLHEEGHYVCAYDMALISQELLKIPEFLKITGTRSYTIPATNKNVARPLANHHQFIRKTKTYEYAIGGKTGATDEALNTLVTFAQKDGMVLICVVLREAEVDQMYDDTKTLCDYAFDNYTAYNIEDNELGGNATFSSLFSNAIAFPNMDDSGEDILSIDTSSTIVLPNTATFKDAVKSVSFTQLDEFYHGENTIGSVQYTYNGAVVGAADIIYYVDDYPMNSSVFAQEWPGYMVDPDYAFTSEYAASLQALLNTTGEGTDNYDGTFGDSITSGASADDAATNSDAPLQNSQARHKTVIYLVAGILLIVFFGLYLLCFELPYRRKYH